MKKLLSMLSALAVITSGVAGSVVSCIVIDDNASTTKLDKITLSTDESVSIKLYNTGAKVKQYLVGLYLKEIKKTVAKATTNDFAVAVIKSDSGVIQNNTILNDLTTPLQVQFTATDGSKLLSGESEKMTVKINNDLHSIADDKLNIDYIDNFVIYTNGQKLYQYLTSQFLQMLKDKGLSGVDDKDLQVKSIINNTTVIANNDVDIKNLIGLIKVTFVAMPIANNALVRGTDVLNFNLIKQDISDFNGTALNFNNKSVSVNYSDLINSIAAGFLTTIKAKYDFLTKDDFVINNITHNSAEITENSKIYKFTGTFSAKIVGQNHLINSALIIVNLAQQSRVIDDTWKANDKFKPIDDTKQDDAVRDFSEQYTAQIVKDQAKVGIDQSDFILTASYVPVGTGHDDIRTGDIIKYSLKPSNDALAEGFLTGNGIADQSVTIDLEKTDLTGKQIDVNFRGDPFTNGDWTDFCSSIKVEAANEWTGNKNAASDLAMSLTDVSGTPITTIAEAISQKGKIIKADFQPIADSKIFTGNTGAIDLHLLTGTIDGLSALFNNVAVNLLDTNEQNWKDAMQKDLCAKISASPDYADAVGFLDFDFASLSYNDLILNKSINFNVTLKPDCREWIGSSQKCSFTVVLDAPYNDKSTYIIAGDVLSLNPSAIFVDRNDTKYHAPLFDANLNAILLHFNGGVGQVAFYLYDKSNNAILAFNDKTVGEYNHYYTGYYKQSSVVKPANKSFVYLARPLSNKMTDYNLAPAANGYRSANIAWTFDKFQIAYDDAGNVSLVLMQVDSVTVDGTAVIQKFAV